MADYTELTNAVNALASAVRGCGFILAIIAIVLVLKNTDPSGAIHSLERTLRERGAWK